MAVPVLHLLEDHIPEFQMADDDCIEIFEKLVNGLVS